MFLEVKNVTKSIHGDVVIKNVSLCSERGRVIGLRGINGSGKTMLMRLISGLIRPTKGQVLIDGEVVSKDIPFPRSLGVLIEGPAFLDDYSAMDNLKLIAYPKGKVTAVFLERIVMPRSRSKSPESMTRSVTASLLRKTPLWRRSWSTRVVLP